jgi:hypothetical protein
MATIQGVYLALFGRPADPLGLAFFNSATNNGQNLAGIGPLQSSAEYIARFTGQTNVQIINSIYQSLFNRDADLPGLTFFSNALANGMLTINNIAIAIYDGAQGADKTIRDLKEAAANAFTTALDTAAEVVGYNGAAAAASAAVFIKGVTTTAPTAAQIDAAVVAAVAAGQGGAGTPGATFVLNATVGTADVLGPNSATAATKTTTGDDMILASTTNTLGTNDVVDGGAGVDTLKASFAVTDAADDDAFINFAVTPTLTSVEKVFVTANLTAGNGVAGAGPDGTNLQFFMQNSIGIQQLWNDGSTATFGGAPVLGQIFNNVIFVDVALETTIGIKDTSVTTIVSFAKSTGAADSATVALSGATNFAYVGLDGIETVNVQSTGAANNVTIAGPVVETVNISGDKSLAISLSNNAATLKSISSTATSAVTINLGNFAFSNDVSISVGAGADTVNAAGGIGRKMIISTGDGADTINIDAGKAHSITTGAAADTVFVVADNAILAGSTLAATTTSSKLAADALVISDFTSGTDRITVDSATTRVVLTGTQLADAASQTDLLSAVNKALSFTNPAAGETLSFQFGSDTYIVANNNADNAIGAGDALIKLTGLVSLSVADWAVA